MFRVYLEGTAFGEFKNLKYITNPHNDPVVEVESFAEIFQDYKIPNYPLIIYPGNEENFKVDFTIGLGEWVYEFEGDYDDFICDIQCEDFYGDEESQTFDFSSEL